MKICIFFLIILSLLNCTSKNSRNRDKLEYKSKVQEGWGGPPFEENKEPFDYFYVKVRGKASSESISKKSGGMMHNTCTSSIQENSQEEFYKKLVEGDRGVPKDKLIEQGISREIKEKIMTPRFKECKPTAKPEPGIYYSEYRSCECVLYIRIPGGKKEWERRLKSIE